MVLGKNFIRKFSLVISLLNGQVLADVKVSKANLANMHRIDVFDRWVSKLRVTLRSKIFIMTFVFCN